jgi:CHAT domain-containing protein
VLQSEWADREHSLTDYIGLVRATIAAHCAAGDPGGAVVAAEAGRGIILGAELDSRTDLTELLAAEPALGQQFQQLRQRLNQSENRTRLWAEHDTLLAAIREAPGFAGFMLPPDLAELQAATEGGAAVLVNASHHRSDAIIVTADGPPRLVPLPKLTVDDVVSYALSLLSNDYQRFPEMLDWLADTVVGPILNVLSHKRVWWLPTGVIGLFPLHAVALDHVVSSYIPNLRTLAHARSRPVPVVRRHLSVAMQHTPGFPNLPGTIREAGGLLATQLVDAQATTNAVLTALTSSTWAHFACHASTHTAAPSASGLHLHDRMLSLTEIARLRLPDAELAYLSACSTAHSGVDNADEALHLASACHLAGFRHVIATLWPLHDKVAATAAREFYRRMPAGPAADESAYALHDVVLSLRHSYPGRPELWAALIHSGP